MIGLRSTLVLLGLIALATPAPAETRVALVIGNAAYKHAPALANPKHDAEGVAASLKRLKFDVVLGVDLDEAGMRRALREFAGKVEGLGKDDVALVFYAGHGLQVNGGNYLVPVDAKLEKESDLAFQAVSLDFLSKLLEQTPHTNIVILDACRDNPLARTLARGMGTRSTGIGRGMAEMRGINDTLIVFATNPGNVALDGDTKHSPFTEALLKHIERPGLEVRHMVAEVRAAVIAATKGKQVPWESASLTRQIYFAPAAAPGATPAPSPAPAAPQVPDNEALFWQSIKDSKNAADYKDYLARWPSGVFAEIAKRRIAEIDKAAVVAPPAPAPEKPAAVTPPSPAPDKPVEPARTRRTSTFVRGAYYTGDRLHTGGDTRATALQCLARCVANAQCVAWYWTEEKPPSSFAPGLCGLVRNIKTRLQQPNVTSGEIRTTPAAAQPKAPPRGLSPMAEIQRKADAREQENGFCATTGWQLSTVASQAFFEAQIVGSVHAYARDSHCEMWRIILAGTSPEGRRCVRVREWTCSRGRDCRTTERVIHKGGTQRWEIGTTCG